MFGEFAIDKGRDLPAYRQLIERIRQLIRERKLLAGDRLPPERELARHLDLARGTVKKAYEGLARERRDRAGPLEPGGDIEQRGMGQGGAGHGVLLCMVMPALPV